MAGWEVSSQPLGMGLALGTASPQSSPLAASLLRSGPMAGGRCRHRDLPPLLSRAEQEVEWILGAGIWQESRDATG